MHTAKEARDESRETSYDGPFGSALPRSGWTFGANGAKEHRAKIPVAPVR